MFAYKETRIHVYMFAVCVYVTNERSKKQTATFQMTFRRMRPSQQIAYMLNWPIYLNDIFRALSFLV